MGLIQTPEQLKFSYQAIIEGAKQLSQPSTVDKEVNSVLLSIFVYFMLFLFSNNFCLLAGEFKSIFDCKWLN